MYVCTQGRTLVAELFGDQQDDFLAEWIAQRWSPQFPSLGADPRGSLPPSLCMAPAATVATKAVKLLKEHCENWGAQLGERAETAYIRYEVASVLDYLPASVVGSVRAQLNLYGGGGGGGGDSWTSGDVVDIESEDGWETGATILGPAASGSATEMSVRFVDGVVDDWEVAEFRTAADGGYTSAQTLALLVRSVAECGDAGGR